MEDTETQQQNPCGLKNQGATCYLNSVLQVLFVTPEICGRFDTNQEKTDQKLRNIFKQLEKSSCGTETIPKILGIQNVFQQRDASDCLEMILRKVGPEVSEIFKGKLVYVTKCCKGHIINEEANLFWTLPLSLTNNPNETYSVERGFEEIFQTKSYSGANRVYCSTCKEKGEATIGCKMVTFPSILILLLKRFDFDYNTMSHFKTDCCVAVPYELKPKDMIYTVYGIVNHRGSLRGGHYTATVLSTEDNTWYDCDDGHVTKTKEHPSAKNKPYNSRTAYLLMYREKRKGQQGEPMGSNSRGEIRTGGKRSISKKDSRNSTDNKPAKQSTDNIFAFIIIGFVLLVLIIIVPTVLHT